MQPIVLDRPGLRPRLLRQPRPLPPSLVDVSRLIFEPGWSAQHFDFATSRLVNPSVGATATHTPDCLLDVGFTANGATHCQFSFRRRDANNRWLAFANNDGSMGLVEFVGGVATYRITAAAGTVTVGVHRLMVRVLGNVYTLYLDNVIKGSPYTDPNSYFVTETTLRVDNVSGGISELNCWPRYPSLPGGL